MFFSLLRFQRADLCFRFALCDCRGLSVESDLVYGLEQGLREGGHDHLRVGFGDPEVSHPRQFKQPLHCAKALFGNQLAKALLRLAWWSTAHRFLQDATAMLTS